MKVKINWDSPCLRFPAYPPCHQTLPRYGGSTPAKSDGVLAIMGLIPVLQTTFGLIPIFGNDVWLHALTAVIAGFVGFMTPPESAVQSAQEQREMAGTRR